MTLGAAGGSDGGVAGAQGMHDDGDLGRGLSVGSFGQAASKHEFSGLGLDVPILDKLDKGPVAGVASVGLGEALGYLAQHYVGACNIAETRRVLASSALTGSS